MGACHRARSGLRDGAGASPSGSTSGPRSTARRTEEGPFILVEDEAHARPTPTVLSVLPPGESMSRQRPKTGSELCQQTFTSSSCRPAHDCYGRPLRRGGHDDCIPARCCPGGSPPSADGRCAGARRKGPACAIGSARRWYASAVPWEAVPSGIRGCASSGGDSSGSARRAGTGPRPPPCCKGSSMPEWYQGVAWRQPGRAGDVARG